MFGPVAPFGRRRFGKTGWLIPASPVGPGASDVIALIGRSGSAAGDRPWKIMGDSSVAALSAGEYPNPLTGSVNGADVFWIKGSSDIRMLCGDNATIGANAAPDGYLSTSVPTLTTYASQTFGKTLTNCRLNYASTPSTFVFSPTGVRHGSRIWGLELSATTPHAVNACYSTDGGASFTDIATGATFNGAASGLINTDSNNFACIITPTPGVFTQLSTSSACGLVSLNGTSLSNFATGNISDYATQRVQAAINYATAAFGCAMSVIHDSANSRLIIAGCKRPTGGGAGIHCIWTLPTSSLSSTWTLAKADFVAAGAGTPDACTTLSIIGDGYVYLSYKRTTTDSSAILYRALLSDLTTWTSVCTLTSCVNAEAPVFKLADNKLYCLAGGSGLWRSDDGSNGSWTQILSSGSAMALTKVL